MQVDFCEFEASLVYTVSFKPARTSCMPYKDLVFKKGKAIHHTSRPLWKLGEKITKCRTLVFLSFGFRASFLPCITIYPLGLGTKVTVSGVP